MRLQALWVEAAVAAEDGRDFARRLEDAGVFVRIDPAVEPLAFRGATVSRRPTVRSSSAASRCAGRRSSAARSATDSRLQS